MKRRGRWPHSKVIYLTQFTDLGLPEPILKALAAKNYSNPTPIQLKAIPPLLDGRDLCGIAQTGTGKTAAFALPSLAILASNPKHRPPQGCRMLVLSPTRELASQIADSFVAYGKFLRLSVATVFGGVPINRQIRQLQAGVDILVATPGRLLDLIDQRALSLKNVEIFVLDEADQMLDLGFIHALKRIDQLLPKKRQSLFFSATMPKAIAELGDRFLSDPVKVSVAPQSTTAERVEQFATFVNQAEKQALLTLRIRSEPIDRALVFTRTKHGADRVVKHLKAAGIGCEAIHGNKSQPQRERALGAFRKGEIKILVATDIAARGIDVGGVSHVFNFELPNVPEQYVHRIGRTARAGAAGIAIAFIADDERPYQRAIEKLTRVKMEIQPLPENFIAEKAKLPKPAASQPSDGRGDRQPRRHDGERPATGERQRRFPPRRSGSVGRHAGAVRKTGGR
ncbi:MULTISPECIES: DEAD/DEAH box helicase [Sphingomonadales]|uniref:ATP-dependent helicase n=2 Tax=Edaphosphingomonas TaxID=3423724 RepID=A0A2T4HUD7_9SPHN|nr:MULTISPECIES: DEAD/DEAH box helicase [Sphingomonas]OHT20377.1 ATP-dependent RNA helicase RhlE [Sphingomonas haloaromaticamans]PTD19411.1 ATP-dependent helicase [Sphingomonas fennica]